MKILQKRKQNIERQKQIRENGIDVSLKAQQKYLDEKGIDKKIEDMTELEKHSLRVSLMFKGCLGKEIYEMTRREKKLFAKEYSKAIKEMIN